MNPKWNLLHALWAHRTTLLVLVLIVSLIAPQPVRAQLGIDWGAIVAAINSIGAAISNTIVPALRAINGALGTLNGLMSSIQAFFTNIVYPQAAMSLIAPQPVRAQLGIDWGAIVAAINSIGAAISNTIVPRW